MKIYSQSPIKNCLSPLTDNLQEHYNLIDECDIVIACMKPNKYSICSYHTQSIVNYAHSNLKPVFALYDDTTYKLNKYLDLPIISDITGMFGMVSMDINRIFKIISSFHDSRRAVCVIIRNEEGKVLGVSRKNDHTCFGLAGGKVNHNEDVFKAAIRETKEETGLDIYDLKLVDKRLYGEDKHSLYFQHCFTAKYKGDILTREELDRLGEFGLVEWLDESEFTNGFFSEYNKLMFELSR